MNRIRRRIKKIKKKIKLKNETAAPDICRFHSLHNFRLEFKNIFFAHTSSLTTFLLPPTYLPKEKRKKKTHTIVYYIDYTSIHLYNQYNLYVYTPILILITLYTYLNRIL